MTEATQGALGLAAGAGNHHAGSIEFDRIRDVNPAAETFLNASLKSLRGHRIWDKIFVDAPLEDAVRGRAQAWHVAVRQYAVDVGTGDKASRCQCNLQIAPLIRDRRAGCLVISSRAIWPAAGPAPIRVKSAAKSAIGMAEMLAHEIKNPLAGITGAAQLLSHEPARGGSGADRPDRRPKPGAS
jgi:two-component system nitrogen regulation sensor histidine kinase GlnL